MKENIRTDYLKFLLMKAKSDLSRFNLSDQEFLLINRLFDKLTKSENLLTDLYILSHIKEFRNIGKYFIFVLKKTEDSIINFENLSQNLNSDSEFIQNELLQYFSNPKLKDSVLFKGGEQSTGDDDDEPATRNFHLKKEEYPELTKVHDEEKEDEPEIADFRKNYLELIQTEDSGNDFVYELPVSGEDKPGMNIEDAAQEEEVDEDFRKESDESSETEEIEVNDENTFDFEEKISTEEVSRTTDDEQADKKEDDLVIKKSFEDETKVINNEIESKNGQTGRISFTDDMLSELENYEESGENEEEDEIDINETVDMEPANALFGEYEKELRLINENLNNDFEKMIAMLRAKDKDDEKRKEIINRIISLSGQLEVSSRKMSLEIISNIYQTMTLSFEKIAEGKYDLSESTLNLFKNGLSLVLSLIKGDDYFGYKDILKSIENIRGALIEEKEKREKYLMRLQEKLEQENITNEKYPDDKQKQKLALLIQLIKDNETKFNDLEKITGEYQIYEALRSLSGNLTNLKEIVKISRDLGMNRLIKLTEASYIFLKFLQNYRINPSTTEIKEIFRYIIYNLKSLAMGKEPDDVDLFISYLSDPVKIFSKKEKKKS
ncbi:MAG: hypothetical protein SGI89_10985 [bacterium]|nr:hypothetical protein [bacterium]